MKKINIEERTKTFNQLRMRYLYVAFRREEIISLLNSHKFSHCVINYMFKHNVFEKMNVEKTCEKRYFFKEIPLYKDKLLEIYTEVNSIAKKSRVKHQKRLLITERVKTFKDACKELGSSHPLVVQYKEIRDNFLGHRREIKDIIAYLKLRIIVAALNEGWEPKFEKDEYRYAPWFCIYTNKQYGRLDNEKKERCVPLPLRSNSGKFSNYDFMFCNASCDVSAMNTGHGPKLTFKTYKLASYAAKQFIEEWADFVF